MPVKLIGLDLDGTVFNRRKEVTERTARALREAKACGTEVVFVTGRPFSGVPCVLLDRTGVRFVITSNGAVTTDTAGGEILRSRLIDRSHAEEVAGLAARSGLWCAVFHGGYGYLEKEHYDALLGSRRGKANYEYLRTSRFPVESLADHIRQSPEEIENIWIPTADLKTREELLASLDDCIPGHRFHIVLCEGTDLELGAEGADKGLAFLALAEALGIGAADTMAVGDDGNDLGLLKAAGFSVAMGNASPAVKEACSAVTEDCDEDGAALAVERWVTGRREYAAQTGRKRSCAP